MFFGIEYGVYSVHKSPHSPQSNDNRPYTTLEKKISDSIAEFAIEPKHSRFTIPRKQVPRECIDALKTTTTTKERQQQPLQQRHIERYMKRDR